MGKTRVGIILKEAVRGGKSGNRSSDLENLSGKFEAFVKQLKGLLTSLQQHHASILQLRKTRLQVAKSLSGLTKETPLFEHVGVVASADRPASTVCSYSSIHEEMGEKTKSFADKYAQFVVNYVAEWEKVVSNRVAAGLKKTEELRRDLDHYQSKVEDMRLRTNQAMAKGKQVDPKAAEKLSRNEEKLLSAKQNYGKVSNDMCILLEEITERSWRDLHPILIKITQFDLTLSDDEAKMMQNLNQVVSQLKKIGSTSGLKAQGRLKDLESLKPSLLSTKVGGESEYKQIEAGDAASSVGGSVTAPAPGYSMEPMALPPGSVGAQSMGGMPLAISSSSYQENRSYPENRSRASSFGSSQSGNFPQSSAPSTLNMMTISTNAAPAPTLEQVQEANNFPLSVRSAPSSGNYGPLVRSRTRSGTSFNDNDSMSAFSASGSFAAPPAAPPPPPPSVPPPPPPPMHGYGMAAPPPMAGVAPAMSPGNLTYSYSGESFPGGGRPDPPSAAAASTNPWGYGANPFGPPPPTPDNSRNDPPISTNPFGP